MIPRQNVHERFTAPFLVEEGGVLDAVRQVHAAPVVTRGAGEVRDHLTDGAFASAVAVADELHLVGAERPGAGAGLSAGAGRVDVVGLAHGCARAHQVLSTLDIRDAHLNAVVARETADAVDPLPAGSGLVARRNDVAAGVAVRDRHVDDRGGIRHRGVV